ncbi:fibronectin type III-like domain-contianing protein [Entomohabitans teleogrylli]|uniref:fibronectin type III-like domain-contianing protein n=1 Tax=Entomohabitans teleogrylli TaxID=1384589 RepID=UPI00073DA64C|nr:fibronectin type III-like domain-contianing protein [Entomohabitans teleogrylli]
MTMSSEPSRQTPRFSTTFNSALYHFLQHLQRDAVKSGFDYGPLAFASKRVKNCSGEVIVTLEVVNRQTCKVNEIVRLYVCDKTAQPGRLVHALKGFQPVELEAGEKARLTFRIPVDMLSVTGDDGRRWVRSSTLEFRVGTSGMDIRSSGEVTLEGPDRILDTPGRCVSLCEVWQETRR